uniref:DnaJ-like protein C11 C-terminal domain-containing protein n=1 Tax=viral metagenome TaxID=1070528 RepID=A0A6C0JW26_9ZZZZ
MSTGLVIQNATYAGTDVTSAVSKQVHDGTINFTVSPATFGMEDPSPGVMKSASIRYSINGGSSNSITAKDGELVHINAPPKRDASGLQITKGEYGYAGNYTDVTNALQDLMKDGSINITVGFKQLGLPDPNPNKQKNLIVQYTLNGAASEDVLVDGQPFQLSAPPKEEAPHPLKDGASSLFGILFSAIFKFLGTFLYAWSVFIAYRFGNQLISPYLWGALAFFLPGFAFWGLPMIVFWIRLFSSSDVYVESVSV